MKEILRYPHPALKVVATKVEDFNSEETLDIIRELKDAYSAFNAEGVAATQLGYDKRIIVTTGDKKQPVVMINPRILDTEGSVKSTEGCLSFPGVKVVLERPDMVGLVYTSEEGQQIATKLAGLQAVAVVHEIDHLNGVTMVDHLGPMAKRLALKRLKKVKRRIKHITKKLEKSLPAQY